MSLQHRVATTVTYYICMDITVERRTSEEGMLENAEPCQSDSNDVNDIQVFQPSSEKVNNTTRDSKPGEEVSDKTSDDQGFVKPSEDFICGGTRPSRIPFVPDINSVRLQVPSSDEHLLHQSLALESEEESRNEFSKICDHPTVSASKSFDDVEDTIDGNVCARTSLIYDHTKRQCLESKSFLASHKNSEVSVCVFNSLE